MPNGQKNSKLAAKELKRYLFMTDICHGLREYMYTVAFIVVKYILWGIHNIGSFLHLETLVNSKLQIFSIFPYL